MKLPWGPFAAAFFLTVLAAAGLVRFSHLPVALAHAKPPVKNGATVITTCSTVITTPGVYTVSLENCSTLGVEINVSDVTIEDFYLGAPCIANCGIGILVLNPSGGPLTNIKLLNGSIESFTTAVSFAGVSRSQITGVYMGNGSTTCLELNADANGDPSQFDIFTSNTFYACSTVDVIGNAINHSTFIGNSFEASINGGSALGLEILSGKENTVSGNTSKGLAVGIQLGGSGSTGATKNVLTGNTTSSDATGILVTQSANGNNFSDNFSTGNTTLDIDDENSNCGTDKWRNDVFVTSNQTCIQ